MDNNKNLLKTEDKSRSELRKMFPHDGEHEINSLDVKKSHKQQGQSLKNTTTRS
jgi:hypothetical protein